jgi:large subunit ribosomal protein L17
MRHRVRKSRLGRRPDHQLALRRNLVFALLTHEKITTTLAKAKMVRPVVERLITIAKRGLEDEENIAQYERRAISFFTSGQNKRNLTPLNKKQRREKREAEKQGIEYKAAPERPRIVKRLFQEIAPKFSTRPGGYTRILKLEPRLGDNADMAVISLV